MADLEKVTYIPSKLNGLVSLNQIYSMGWEYALAHQLESGELQQVNVWATCKDYLNDIVWAFLNNVSANIYGMVYSEKNNGPIDLSPLRILVRNKRSSSFLSECKNSLKVIHAFEEKFGFKLSVLKEASSTLNETTPTFHLPNSEDVVCLFESDEKWAHSTPLLSFYSIILRCGCLYKDGCGDPINFIKDVGKGKYGSYHGANDPNYLSCIHTSETSFNLLLEKGISIFGSEMKLNYPASRSLQGIHNLGFQAWLNNSRKGVDSYYRRQLLEHWTFND